MLAKLIKYDLKSMLRTMFPLWAAVLVVSILFGIQLIIIAPDQGATFMDGQNGILFLILSLLLFGVFTAMFVLNIIVVIQRFWRGLLKEEGYLMFTLPVSTRFLIISKALSALIINMISVVASFLCIFLIVTLGAFATRNNLSVFWFVDLWNSIMDSLDGSILDKTGWVLYWIIVGLLNLLDNTYHAYAAMSIGQMSNKNRFITSIIAYLGLSFAVSTVTVPLMSFGYPDNLFRFNWFTISTQQITLPVLLLGLMVNIVQIAAYHVITEFILTKNLNLE